MLCKLHAPLYFEVAAAEKDSFGESYSSSDSSSESEAEQEKEVTKHESAKTEGDKTDPEKDNSNSSQPSDNNSDRKPSVDSNQTGDGGNSTASNQKGSTVPAIVVDKCESDKESVSTDALNGNEDEPQNEPEEPRPKTRLERRGDLDPHRSTSDWLI